jgi:hypothetical protein
VSNDVLLNFIAFLWLGCLLQFVTRPTTRAWFLVCFVLSLGLITKASALPLLGLSLLSLVIIHGIEWRQKRILALTILLFAVISSGWYYIPRFLHEDGASSFLVGNIHDLNPKSHVSGIFLKSLVFNPFKVLRYPFVFPWGPRHDYFLEYYFKSAFLGEWWLSANYKWMARFFIFFALAIFPVVVTGLVITVRRRIRPAILLATILLGLFIAQWLFVQIAPFMSSQDFRYVVVLTVPIAYFLVEGLRGLPERMHGWSNVMLRLLMINCGAYLIAVALFN